MAVFIALIRGINVGGTGMLPMNDLSALCVNLGFQTVRTYIQSGNVIFESSLPKKSVQAALSAALASRMKKEIAVMVRTPVELQSILSANPFPAEDPAKVAVAFLNGPPPHDLLENAIAPGGEQVCLGKQEIYIFYPGGMGRSKLKLPLKGAMATVRNINTVAKLVAMTKS